MRDAGNASDGCPSCGAELGFIDDEGVPQSRRIGIVLPLDFDGVMFWVCPECEHAWHTWTDMYMVNMATIRMRQWTGGTPEHPEMFPNRGGS